MKQVLRKVPYSTIEGIKQPVYLIFKSEDIVNRTPESDGKYYLIEAICEKDIYLGEGILSKGKSYLFQFSIPGFDFAYEWCFDAVSIEEPFKKVRIGIIRPSKKKLRFVKIEVIDYE